MTNDETGRQAPVRTLHPDLQRQHETAYIGMVIFLGSWAVMFAGLFFAFAMHRVTTAQWPPASLTSIPFGLPVASTVLIALSSVTLSRYGRFVTLGDQSEPCLLYTSPSPRDKRQSRMPSSA